MNFEIAKEKKVLVTGGTGFIAGWIIKQLVEAELAFMLPLESQMIKIKLIIF